MENCTHKLPPINFDCPPSEPDAYRVDVTDMLTSESLSSCIVPAHLIEGESTMSCCGKVHADAFWRRIMKAAGIGQ